MPDNLSFTVEPEHIESEHHTDEHHEETHNEETRIDLGNDSTQTETSYCCCSWSRMCDVLGNRQETFIVALRPLRMHLILTQQLLQTFQLELERGIKTKASAAKTAKEVRACVRQINKITTHVDLNIPPEENKILRGVSYDLTVLARVVEELAISTTDVTRNRSSSNVTGRDVTVREDSDGNVIRDIAVGTNPSIDEHSLKDRIARVCDKVEKAISYIDVKTQRRWWLRDVIDFLKIGIKLALFISAAVSVAYHESQTAPIITLVITIVQGIVDMLDQYFLKHTNPEEIKLSSTIASSTTTK